MHDITNIIVQKKTFFAQGVTKQLWWRKKQLLALHQALITYEQALITALHNDLQKPIFEAYIGEIYLCMEEIKYILTHLDSWVQPQRIASSRTFFPTSASLQYEPYGVVLIIAPWNYPIQLTLIPLIGAIAAGNCAVIKPSEHAPNSASVLNEIITNTFDHHYVSCVMGNKEIAQELLDQSVDYIFFTGGTNVGKLVMHAAAEQLIPFTLELGGKNPCIIDKDINIAKTARLVAWGKFLNAGQNCVSPDYVLIHQDIKAAFLEEMKNTIVQFYGTDPHTSPDYARIINDFHVERLETLLGYAPVFFGGTINRESRYIAPTLIDDIDWDHPLMQEEIFGPILPIFTFETINEAVERVKQFSKPLAIYLFSRNTMVQEKVIQETSSGALGINDLVVQAASPKLPFGGVGMSGIGRYHGKTSFTAFSNQKAILNAYQKQEPWWRYPPYRWIHRMLKRLISYWVS